MSRAEARARVVVAPAEIAEAVGDTPLPPRAKGPKPQGPTHPLWLLAKVLMGLLLVVGGAALVAFGAYRYALTSPRFALQHLEVVGARRLTAQNLASKGGVLVGQNLLGLDLAQVEAKIEEDPWVKRVRVARRLPSTLSFELEEYEASALALLSDTLFLVTREGEPFKKWEATDPGDLPMLSGVTAEDIKKDRERALRRLSDGVSVLREYDRLGMSRVLEAQEVHLDSSGKARLIVGNDGLSLELGTGPYRQKLLLAERVYQRLRSQNRAAGILFLDNEAHTERVVVRMK